MRTRFLKNLRALFAAFIIMLAGAPLCFSQEMKAPNVSGQFYSANPKDLSVQIDHFLFSPHVDPPA